MYDNENLQNIFPCVLNFGNEICGRLGLKQSNIYIRYNDANKGKEYKLNHHTIDLINHSLKTRVFDTFSIISAENITEDKWKTNFEIEVLDFQPQDHNQNIFIYIDSIILNQSIGLYKFNFFCEIYKNLLNYGVIEYSYLTDLKYFSCRTFVKGIITQDLDINEKINIVLWQNNLGMRKSFMRGIYLGNYMGPGHLAKIDDLDTFLKQLSDLVGIDNISRFGDQSIFFMLPEDNFDQCKNHTESLLNKYNLLLNTQNAEKNVEKSLSLLY